MKTMVILTIENGSTPYWIGVGIAICCLVVYGVLTMANILKDLPDTDKDE